MEWLSLKKNNCCLIVFENSDFSNNITCCLWKGMFREKQGLHARFPSAVGRVQWKQYELHRDVFYHPGSHQETLLEEETICGLRQRDVWVTLLKSTLGFHSAIWRDKTIIFFSHSSTGNTLTQLPAQLPEGNCVFLLVFKTLLYCLIHRKFSISFENSKTMTLSPF